MKVITVSEFRRNIREYSELAKSEKILVSRGEGEGFYIVPLSKLDDKAYDQEFVKKILDAEKSAKQGSVTKIADAEDIWKDIL